MPLKVPHRLRLEAERSPLVLPVLTGISAILWADGHAFFLFAVAAGVLTSLALQGIKGGTAALVLSLALSGLHVYRIGEYEQWKQYWAQDSFCHFSGSAVKTTPGRLILEGYPLHSRERIPHSPCRLEVIIPSSHPAGQEAPLFPPGKRYEVRGEIRPEQPLLNPGEFDHSTWQKREGIHVRVLAHSLEEKGPGSWKSRILALSSELNAFLCRRLDQGMTPGDPRGEVVKSLVLGARNEASRETVDLFRYSGLLHIFAVSGLHVSLVALLLSPLLLLAGLRPKAFCLLLSLLLLLYTFATGLSVSANRAVLMIIVVLTGVAFTRNSTSANRLALAALLLLLWNSQSLFQLGFLLSFLIFATVVAAAGSFSQFDRWLRPDDYIPPLLYTRGEKIKYAVNKYLFATLFISLSAWVAATLILTPVTGYLSPYTPVVNTLLSLPVTLLMACGLLSLLMGGLPLLGSSLAACNQHLAGLLISTASFSLTLPGAVTPLSSHVPAGQVTIFTLNGTNYSAAMGNPALLLNCGTESDARHVLIPGLQKEGYIPGIIALQNRTKTEEPGLHLIREKYHGARIFPPETKSPFHTHPVLENGFGGRISLLDTPDVPLRRKADNSSVFLWEFENCKILFLGNAGYNAERRLMKNYPELRANVLVLGLHSSDYSGTPDFVRFLSPSLIVHTAPAPFAKETRVLQLLKNKQETPQPALWNLKTQGAVRLHLSRDKCTWEEAR